MPQVARKLVLEFSAPDGLPARPVACRMKKHVNTAIPRTLVEQRTILSVTNNGEAARPSRSVDDEHWLRPLTKSFRAYKSLSPRPQVDCPNSSMTSDMLTFRYTLTYRLGHLA